MRHKEPKVNDAQEEAQAEHEEMVNLLIYIYVESSRRTSLVR